MYFLGQASNFRACDVLRHTFAFGIPKDSENLRRYLAKRYIGDDKTNILEKVTLYGTGRSALAAAIQDLVPSHSEVCATALTCYAVVQAIEAAGCSPVFADVDPNTLHYGAEELERAIKKHPHIRAVIIQNNLGHPADINGIMAVAKRNKLIIIEDLAHSAGIHYANGCEAGTVGDATVLSFGKGKAIDTIAGGALILRQARQSRRKNSHQIPRRRPHLANSLRARWYPFFGACIRGFYHLKLGRYFTSLLLKLHFIERSADAPLSLDTRCTHWQAKLALRQLQNLPSPRPPLRDFYLVDHRDQLLHELEERGYVFNDTWYDTPVAPERYFKQAHFNAKECPIAATLAEQIVNVPTHYSKSAMRPALKIIQKYDIKRKIGGSS